MTTPPLLTPLRRIATPGGDVLHGIRATDPGFAGFGEAYFSTVEHRCIKGWKRHERMTLNFIVPCGCIQVAVWDEAAGVAQNYVLGPATADTYARLTILPGAWVAFGGIGTGLNLLLNVASLAHDPAEARSRPLDDFAWHWQQAS